MAKLVHGKKKATSLKEWLIWQIRRLSYRWPPRNECLREAGRTRNQFERNPGVDPRKVTRRVRNFFECADCEKIFPRRGVSVDHVDPVVQPKIGWESWDIYLARLFCDAEGYQILCNECHDSKTEKERAIRTKYRRLRKQ